MEQHDKGTWANPFPPCHLQAFRSAALLFNLDERWSASRRPVTICEVVWGRARPYPHRTILTSTCHPPVSSKIIGMVRSEEHCLFTTTVTIPVSCRWEMTPIPLANLKCGISVNWWNSVFCFSVDVTDKRIRSESTPMWKSSTSETRWLICWLSQGLRHYFTCFSLERNTVPQLQIPSAFLFICKCIYFTVYWKIFNACLSAVIWC